MSQDQQYFPPPPPNSGAGKDQSLPMTDTPASAHPTAQVAELQASYPGDDGFPPPPPGPPPKQQHVPQFAVDEVPPPQPPRPQPGYEQPPPQTFHPQQGAQYIGQPQGGLYVPPPPPRRLSQHLGDTDINSPVHYTRDPKKLVGYLVPFPKPAVKDVDPAMIPDRFLIYTPPPPPLHAPAEGEKEAKLHKVQRKWQEEVRSAKTNTDKVTSWKGIKSRATKGIDKAMGYTTTSNIDFLGRVSGGPQQPAAPRDTHAEDGVEEADQTKKTVGIEEMVLIYPESLGMDENQIREEFVNTMLRTKTKAQRDAIISTGLMPVAYGIDILATFVWPFGGLGEIDTVWAYNNIRGAKTARSVTRRLNSSGTTGDAEKEKLHLHFTASPRIELLRKYLAADCHKTDSRMFPGFAIAPTETDVLEAIGWSPSQAGGQKNWEDEQWEMNEVKDDLRLVMHKSAREWDKWCKAFQKDPEKAMKK